MKELAFQVFAAEASFSARHTVPRESDYHAFSNQVSQLPKYAHSLRIDDSSLYYTTTSQLNEGLWEEMYAYRGNKKTPAEWSSAIKLRVTHPLQLSEWLAHVKMDPPMRPKLLRHVAMEQAMLDHNEFLRKQMAKYVGEPALLDDMMCDPDRLGYMVEYLSQCTDLSMVDRGQKVDEVKLIFEEYYVLIDKNVVYCEEQKKLDAQNAYIDACNTESTNQYKEAVRIYTEIQRVISEHFYEWVALNRRGPQCEDSSLFYSI
jgi:hypothetical protein